MRRLVCLSHIVDSCGALLASCTSALHYLCKARPEYVVPHCSVIESFLSIKGSVCHVCISFTDCREYITTINMLMKCPLLVAYLFSFIF